MTERKFRLLAHSDYSKAGTGFGVVSHYVLNALYETGLFHINHLAINHHGEFSDDVPWQVQPARLLDPEDPHGRRMFAKTLMENEYDFVFILNDIYVTHSMVPILNKVREQYLIQGKQPPKFVYYYPVDCKVQRDVVGMIQAADIPVCYTLHGQAETLKAIPEVEHKLQRIPHGVDTEAYYPLPQTAIAVAKQKYLNVSPDTFVVMQVNRNSIRKQIPYSMLAFKEFKKLVPNAILYLHTMVVDQGIDLRKVMEDLDLKLQTDIVFPAYYSPSRPFPQEIINQFYNMGDLFLTTTLGEGYGLSVVEAMAAGTPVVVGDHTCMKEHIGFREDRGYLYPCKDKTWIDLAGFRPKGLIDDILNKMVQVYKEGPKWDNPITRRAREWAVYNDWKQITPKWVNLFNQLINSSNNEVPDSVVTQEV